MITFRAEANAHRSTNLFRLLGLTWALSIIGHGVGFAAQDVGARPPGQFDYYVLSLTWVPGFCATKHNGPAECQKGLGFALHGLWPQLEGGNYPSFCSQTALTSGERSAHLGLYADDSLLDHEWPKHGTCSGLSPTDYFQLSASDVQRVVAPAAYRPDAVITSSEANAVGAAFVAANPGLPVAGINTVTAHGVLTEVDICLTKSGEFRAC